jgi:hypothetical protein
MPARRRAAVKGRQTLSGEELRVRVDRLGLCRQPDQAERSAICSAITALSEALASERQRVIRGEQEIAELRGELADARGAERISSDATAALRHQLDLLLARRPWWRRWFR